MTMSRDASRRTCVLLAALSLAFFLASCDDDTPTSGNPTTTSTPPTGSTSASLRAAPMTFDARNVEMVVGNQTISGLSYPEVSDYIQLAPGEYNVQFFQAGNRTTPLGETTVNLSSNEASTAALVGLSTFDVMVFEDQRNGNSSQAGVSLVNTVPDFPADFDLRVANGNKLFEGVGYLETSDMSDLASGSYTFELLRGGTNEVVASSTNNNLASGTSNTIFVTGSLRRGDIQLVVAEDAP